MIVTNRDAPLNKLVKVDLSNAEDPTKWETLIEHNEKRLLECIVPFGKNKFLALYLEDVHHVLQIHDLETAKLIEKIPLPIGTVSSIHTRLNRTEVFFAFESILDPPSTYRFDYAVSSNPVKLELIHQAKIQGYNPTDFQTKQVFYKSKDGTQIPMFITAKKDIEMNNKHPTLLYGCKSLETRSEIIFEKITKNFFQL